MMRKVFSNGPSLVVTLPSEWVKKHGIEAGQEISVDEIGELLHLSPGKSVPKPREVDLDCTDLDRTMLRCFIRSAYRKGFDCIRAHSSSEKVHYHRTGQDIALSYVVRQEVNHLVGTEITEEDRSQFVIKKISEDSATEFGALLRRIFLRQVNYSREIHKLLKKESAWDAAMFESEYDNIKSTISYVLRIITKLGSGNADNDHMLYHITANLDLVNDLLKYSVRDVTLNKVSSLRAIDIAGTIGELFSLYYQLFYHYSNKNLVTFSWKRRSILQQIDNFIEEGSSQEVAFLFRLGQAVEILYFTTIEIMGLSHK